MIVVISPEQHYPKETLWANRLLEARLECFHIRKPHWDDEAVAKYVSEIDQSYHTKIVLHDRLEVSQTYGLKRLHITEKKRKNKVMEIKEGMTYSTSVHNMADFNELEMIWDYAFVSPIFPSLSKVGYGQNTAVFHQLKSRKNFHTKLIGLGGVAPENISNVYEAGVDGVALLGYIWQSKNPLNAFMLCKS
jgi:thiamine-phosphate pyrophosphorylase